MVRLDGGYFAALSISHCSENTNVNNPTERRGGTAKSAWKENIIPCYKCSADSRVSSQRALLLFVFHQFRCSDHTPLTPKFKCTRTFKRDASTIARALGNESRKAS